MRYLAEFHSGPKPVSHLFNDPGQVVCVSVCVFVCQYVQVHTCVWVCVHACV